MGFFDGLRRDKRNQAKKYEEQSAVQRAPIEKVEVPAPVVEPESEPEPVEDNKLPSMKDIEPADRYAAVEDVRRESQPLKTYRDKKPVEHVVGQTKIIAIINSGIIYVFFE